MPTVAAACAIGGVTAGFSPVRGLLSKQVPVPTYTAHISGIILSGNISAVLDNGEVCKGPWTLISQSTIPTSATPTGTAAPNVSAPGNRLDARAVLTGNMGTVLNVEFTNEHNTRGNTKGVAEDNKGNLFKMSVYN